MHRHDYPPPLADQYEMQTRSDFSNTMVDPDETVIIIDADNIQIWLIHIQYGLVTRISQLF